MSALFLVKSMCLQMLSASSMAAQIVLFFQADFVKPPPPTYTFFQLRETPRNVPSMAGHDVSSEPP